MVRSAVAARCGHHLRRLARCLALCHCAVAIVVVASEASAAQSPSVPALRQYQCEFFEGTKLMVSVDMRSAFPLTVKRCKPLNMPSNDVPATALAMKAPTQSEITVIEGPLVPSITSIATPRLSKDIDGLVRQTSRRYGVDYRLVHAVIHAESRGNPKAVSPKGAIGLMQVMPATGQRYGVTSAASLRDPAVNIDVGVRYLRDLSDMFGRRDLVVAAYNAGEGRVVKAGYEIPPIPETRAYVAQVLSFYDARQALAEGVFP